MLGKLGSGLAATGLKPQEIWLSPRRAWQVGLDNGVKLDLGRGDVEARVGRFALYWKDKLAALPYHIDYVDMRYPNGFAVRMPDYKAPPAQVKK